MADKTLSPTDAALERDRKVAEQLTEKLKLDDAFPVFDSSADAVDYVRGALATMPADSRAEAVQAFLAQLKPEERDRLFTALLTNAARKFKKLKNEVSNLYELSEGYGRGEYPYKNRYPAGLYEKELYNLQVELLKLQEWVKKTGSRIVVVFEGRDTAGKGGTIRRFTENLNPRGARIVALSKPTEAEARQWYFQRYAAQLPNPGEICFFDRSWYNRGVVEPVMGFCTPEQTKLFLSEVAGFERSLVNSGIILVKFWLSISREEQLRRFRDRQTNPLKRWKLSPVDIASIDKWDDYSKAMQAMFLASDTPFAPWTVIRNEDKRRGRLNAIRTLLRLVDYDGRNLEHVGSVDPLIVGRSEMLVSQTTDMRLECASGGHAEDAAKARRIRELEAQVKEHYRKLD